MKPSTLLRMPLAMLLPAMLLLASCLDTVDEQAAKDSKQFDLSDAIEKSRENGPIRADIKLAPKSPEIGDVLHLELKVTAEAGVHIEMPAFGDALGRFSIVDFSPRQQRQPDGTQLFVQRYTLQVPMSGKQRIPPLRVEYQDKRNQNADAAAKTNADAAAKANAGAGTEPDAEIKELLSDEIPVEVRSVLPDSDLQATLHPAFDFLNPDPGPTWFERLWKFGALGLALLFAVIGLLLWKKSRGVRAQRSAYELAISRLVALEHAGSPTEDQVDNWYVELSAIVRNYLEGRFGIRAPELTTEEFIRTVRDNHELSEGDRAFLGEFLAHCDQVKFAAYHPSDDERGDAMTSARRFIESSRLNEDDDTEQPVNIQEAV